MLLIFTNRHLTEGTSQNIRTEGGSVNFSGNTDQDFLVIMLIRSVP